MDSLNLSQVIFSKQQLGNLVCAPTDLKDGDDTKNMIVYPNPIEDILFVEGLNETDIQVQIYSLLGKPITVVSNYNDGKLKINLAELPKGIYILKLSTNNTNSTKRIVKD
jgi:hypothetical protein